VIASAYRATSNTLIDLSALQYDYTPAGSMFAEFQVPRHAYGAGGSSNRPVLFLKSDLVRGTNLYIRRDTNKVVASRRDDSSVTSLESDDTFAPGSIVRAVMGWSSTGHFLAVNGAYSETATPRSPAAHQSLLIGQEVIAGASVTSQRLGSEVREIALFTRRLTEAEAINLSAL
jgi:hypothetical protein